MDIDLFKSINSEDQMKMMVMMHMNEMPIMEFSPQGINNNTNNLPQIIHDHNSSTFLNIPSTNISFTNSSTLVHDQESSITLPFLENSTSTIRDYKDQVSLTSHLTFPSMTTKRNNSMGAMREMIFKIAAMQPIHIDPESIKPPKRKNVKISNDPQSIAARHRREKISEKMRVLQRLVPGGTKMDTASMLDEAIHYMKFLKKQVQNLEKARPVASAGCLGFPVPMSLSGNNYNLPMGTRTYHQPYHQCIQP